ncbi:hypothetical protein [Streptomyces corynorhini]|uniref:Uncharacterized protein n=1 Tax=Streptomyces corynorhini TaxID=2282652 RepID=A0A370AR04_9ACTN|nr:hypothetical protein [Streptomyces corynorhini]RDG30083.1 hypothetical protein DVH02_34485 [Streptomyces corynorhini]
MCGVCGRPATGWTERVAPLDPGAATARHRAVRRLLAGTRITVRPWPGGGWQLADRAGRRHHCADLPALWTTVRSLAGPVIAPDPADLTRSWTLPGDEVPRPDPHALVVWTAAALHAGPGPRGLTVRAAGWRLTEAVAPGSLTPGSLTPGTLTPVRCAGDGLTVEALSGARTLARRLAEVMAPAPQGLSAQERRPPVDQTGLR